MGASARFNELLGLNLHPKIVDIGANPISHPIYYWMHRAGDIDIVGFEPAPVPFAQLQEAKGPRETYLPLAVGDGGRHTLHLCFAPGMSSIFEPDPAVLDLFPRGSLWGQVLETMEVDTVRLDDVPETEGLDMISIDIQGAELMALQGAVNRLSTALLIHCEVEFVPIYKGQPLFSEVEIFMRSQGFMLHTFQEMNTRCITPLVLNDDPTAGFNQHFWANAVFIRDLAKANKLSDQELLKLAMLLHDLYQSVDASMRLLSVYDTRHGTSLAPTYLNNLRQHYNSALPA